MKASFSLQSGSFLLLASFLFNVKLPSSPGQTAVSLGRLMHFPFIIFPDAMLLSCLLRFATNQMDSERSCFCTGMGRGPLQIRARRMNVAGTSVAPLRRLEK